MTRARTEHRLRREVVEISNALWERGWVANHDGNVSARASAGRIVATATGLSKRVIDSDKVIVVDESKRVVSGRLRVFSEIGLHLAVMGARPDVVSVVHAHCPYATARGLTRQALPCFLPESVVSLGREIPVVPLAMPGKDAEAELSRFVHDADVVMIEGNGVLAWGSDPEQAFLRLELCEHLCRIAHLAGCVSPLPDAMLEPLLAKRRSAGLGKAGRADKAR